MGEPQTLFQAKFASAAQLSRILRCVSVANAAAHFRLDGSGINIRCMNRAGTLMVEASVPPTGLQQHVCLGTLDFALEPAQLLGALGYAENQQVWLKVLGSEGQMRLLIQLSGGTVELPLDAAAEPLPELRLGFEVDSLVFAAELRALVKRAAGADQIAQICFRRPELWVRLGVFSERLQVLRVDGTVDAAQATYDAGLLKAVLGAPLESKAVRLCFGADMPLLVECTLPIMYSGGAAKLRYYVAPIRG